MASKKMSAVVEIGGAIKNSFRSSVKVLKGDLSGAGDAVLNAKKKLDMLEKYDPQAVRKMGKEHRALKRDAAKLRKEYEATAKPTRKMTVELGRAEGTAKKAGKAYQVGREKLDSMGKSLKKAGVSTHNLAGEHRRLSTALSKSKDKMDRLTRSMAAAGRMKKQLGNTAKIGAGITLAVGVAARGVFSLADSTATLGDNTAKTADKLGMSLGALQELRYAAERSGVSTTNLDSSMERFTKRLGEASMGSGAAKGALEKLGLSAQELSEMSPEEALEVVADRLQEVKNQSEKAAYASALFGKSGIGMVNMVKGGSKALAKLRAEARETGYVLSNKAARDAEVFKDKLLNAELAVKGVKNTLGAALMPVVSNVMGRFSKYIADNHDKIVKFATAVGSAVKNMVPAFLAFGKGLIAVFSTVGSVISGVASLLGGFDNLAIAIGLAFGAKAAVGLYSFGSNLFVIGKAIIPLISSYFPAIITGIKAIGMAVMSNPIGLAIAAVIGAALLVWKYWDPICDFFCNIGSMIGNAVSTGFNFIKTVFMNFNPLGIIIKQWDPIKAWIGNLFGWIGDKAKKVFGFVGSAISGVGKIFGFGNDKKEKETAKKKKEIPVVGDAVSKNSTGITERDKHRLEEAEMFQKHFKGMAKGEKDPQMHSYYANASKDEADKAAKIRAKYGIVPEVGATKGHEVSIPQSKQNVANNNNQQVQNNNITIHAVPGQSEEEIADRVVAKINEADRDNARLAMHD